MYFSPLPSSHIRISTLVSSTSDYNSMKYSHSRNNEEPAITIHPSPISAPLPFQEGDDRDMSKLSQPQWSASAIELITRNIGRDTPATPGLRKSSSKGHSSRKRSMKRINYYAQVFSVREGPAIPKAAGVCVELKTNVIVSRWLFHSGFPLPISD